jgi:excisionase family DNA binding protein
MTQLERSAPPRLLLTPEEAAVSLGISRSLVYELIGSGRLESVRIGTCRRIPIGALETFVEELRLRAVVQPGPRTVRVWDRPASRHQAPDRSGPAEVARPCIGTI